MVEQIRGDTFSKIIVLPPSITAGYFTGWTPASQIRTLTGTLIADLDTTWADEPDRQLVTIFKNDTENWPIGNHEIDVQFTRTSDGWVRSTVLIPLTVVKDVTRLAP